MGTDPAALQREKRAQFYRKSSRNDIAQQNHWSFESPLRPPGSYMDRPKDTVVGSVTTSHKLPRDIGASIRVVRPMIIWTHLQTLPEPYRV